jgi:hypothetical protein
MMQERERRRASACMRPTARLRAQRISCSDKCFLDHKLAFPV